MLGLNPYGYISKYPFLMLIKWIKQTDKQDCRSGKAHALSTCVMKTCENYSGSISLISWISEQSHHIYQFQSLELLLAISSFGSFLLKH